MIKKYREFIITAVLIVLVIVNVFFTVSASASGAELNSIKESQLEITLGNQELTDKITNESSLSVIGKKAEDLGFTKPENIVYVTSIEPVAKLP